MGTDLPDLPDPRTSCYAKKRYSHFEFALKVANKRMHKSGGRLYVYPCYLCGGYHLTGTKGPDVVSR